MIVNLTKATYIAVNVRVANKFFSRLKGLLGTAGLAAGSALVITPCSSVHTFGMGYPIDALFIGAGNKVLRVVSELKPGRMACCSGSLCIIELPAGTAEASRTIAGDEVAITVHEQIK
jgi:uncharacterized membrane protein (UPF0127 family)